MSYPSFWPKADPLKPELLQSRITEQQKEDLYSRKVTTRELAKLLEVHETYLSYRFPFKLPVVDKKPLIEARKAFKLEIAVQVLKGRYSIQQAADAAYVSYNTMQRFVQKAKLAHPELLAGYAESVLQLKQTAMQSARDSKTHKV